MYGRSQMLLFSFGCLIVGTTVGALSNSIELLIAARLVQGFAGGIIPLAFGIVRDVLPAERVAGAIGAISAVLAVGAATGIVLSGPIVTNLGYRWLFWIPLLVIVPAALLAWRVIPPSKRSAREPIDLVGALLLSTWLVALLFGVTQGADWGWTSPGTLLLFAIAAVVLVVWIAVELRMPVPLIDIRLMRRPTLMRINVVGFTTGLAMQAMFTFVPRMVQIPEQDGFGLGVSASNAGLIVLPWSVGAFVTGTFAGRVALQFGLKVPLVTGCVLSVIPGLLLAVAHDRLLTVGIALGIFGVGTGLVAAAMPTIIVLFAPDSQIGVAAGMNQNIRTIGGAIGAQTIGAIIASSIVDGRATEDAYVLSFVVLSMVCVVATVAAMMVPSRPHR
jgi:MFS family permease